MAVKIIAFILLNKFEFKFDNNTLIFNQPNLNGYHQIENASVALAFSKVMAQKKSFNLRKISNSKMFILNLMDQKNTLLKILILNCLHINLLPLLGNQEQGRQP